MRQWPFLHFQPPDEVRNTKGAGTCPHSRTVISRERALSFSTRKFPARHDEMVTAYHCKVVSGKWEMLKRKWGSARFHAVYRGLIVDEKRNMHFLRMVCAAPSFTFMRSIFFCALVSTFCI